MIKQIKSKRKVKEVFQYERRYYYYVNISVPAFANSKVEAECAVKNYLSNMNSLFEFHVTSVEKQ